MSGNVKYCVTPVEDGRCGNAFKTNSIRSPRKYCDECLPKYTNVPNPLSTIKTRNTYKLGSDEKAMRDWVKKQMAQENVFFGQEAGREKSASARLASLERNVSKLKQDFKVWDDVDKLSDYSIKKRAKILSSIENTVEKLLSNKVDNTLMAKLNNKVATLNTKIVQLEQENNKLKKQIKTMNVSVGAKLAAVKKKIGDNKNE
jgi:hypothetical protein